MRLFTLFLMVTLLGARLSEAAPPKLFSAPIIHMAEKQLLTRKAPAGFLAADPGQCANFAGTWKGLCSQDNRSEMIRIEIIQNDCGSLRVDGDSLLVGSNETSAVSHAFFYLGIQTAVKFRPEQDAFQIYGSALMDSPAFEEPFVMGSEHSLRLLEQQTLLIEGKINVSQGGSIIQKNEISCRLSREK